MHLREVLLELRSELRQVFIAKIIINCFRVSFYKNIFVTFKLQCLPVFGSLAFGVFGAATVGVTYAVGTAIVMYACDDD